MEHVQEKIVSRAIQSDHLVHRCYIFVVVILIVRFRRGGESKSSDMGQNKHVIDLAAARILGITRVIPNGLCTARKTARWLSRLPRLRELQADLRSSPEFPLRRSGIPYPPVGATPQA